MAGTILVRFAFLATVFAGILYLYARHKDDPRFVHYARYAFQSSVLLVVSFCLYLLYLILTHQFQYTYVWNYSATTLSTPLLVSTFWAGQEGSFSLWTIYTAVLGIFLLSYTARRNYEKEVMMVWCLIQGALLTMLVIKNPFAMIWDTFPGELVHTGPFPPFAANAVWLDQAKGIWAQYPAQGKGLNPLLQNYWMVIHPQILFTGFTAMAVPYAFAIAGMLKRDYSGWIRTAKPWIVYGAATLGTGIILGGYWAYETLGWGGYWAWDPVENSSLIPWLISIAAIHTFMSQNQSGTYIRTNLVLAMTCFLMVLYSTFLTRSGVLGDTSVHSFVDPGMWAYWFLLGFILLFAGLGTVLIVRRWKDIPVVKLRHSVYSRDFALFLGAFTICFAAVFITIGTSSPIITDIWKGRAAAVDMSYYVKTTLPLGIIIAILAGFGQLLWWSSSKATGLLKALTYPLLSTGVFTAGIVIAGVRDVDMAIFCAAAAFALFVNLQVGYRVFKGNPRFTGGAIAHIGLALLFLGFVSSSKYDEKQTVSLEKGKPVQVLDGYTLTYLGSKTLTEERYGFEVRLEHTDRVWSITPTMHFSSFDNTTLRHPDILNMYSRDFYLTPLSVEPAGTGSGPKGETLVAEASVKPYINLVWVGTVTLIVGFLVTIVRRIRESRLGAVQA